MRVAAAAAVWACAGAASAPPTMTPYQQQLVQRVEQRAANASAVATRQLLEALAQPRLSDCCPSVATLSPSELQGEDRGRGPCPAEVVHGFEVTKARPTQAGCDVVRQNPPLPLHNWISRLVSERLLVASGPRHVA